MTVGEAREAFRARHHELLAAQAGSFTLQLGPLGLALPNPGHLDLHDMHHLALDAPPTIMGEIQVGAFEVRSGFPTAYIGLYDVAAVVLGLLVCPLRTLGWLHRYRGCRSFYDEGPRLDAWLARPLDELLAYLRVRPPRRRRATERASAANAATGSADEPGAPDARQEQPSSAPPSSAASPPPSPALPLPVSDPGPEPLPDPGPDAASPPPAPVGEPDPLPPDPAPGPAPGPLVAAVAVTVGSPGSVPVPNS